MFSLSILLRLGQGLRLSILLGLLGALGGPAMAAEKLAYEVIETYQARDELPAFELRRYPPYWIAEVSLAGDFKQVGNQAFRILFDYIQGANRQTAKIAMTAPVEQRPASPMMQTPAEAGSGSGYRVAFVLPARYTEATIPQPRDQRITIRQIESGLMAAHRYSGSWSQDRYLNEAIRLKNAITATDLTITGKPVFARYNPPFLPGFLRRNEVLMPVAAD